MLVLAIPEDLDKLLEDSGLAAITSLSEVCGVVVVAVYGILMFVVAILGTEDRRTYRACKVLDVELSIQCCDVGSAQGAAAFGAQQVEPSEIICLAEGILVRRLVGDGEEFRGNDLAAILYFQKKPGCQQKEKITIKPLLTNESPH